MRRSGTKNHEQQGELVDKSTFYDYTQLPGIINDRFFNLFTHTSDDKIEENSFIEGMLRVYLSNLEDKMKLTFQM